MTELPNGWLLAPLMENVDLHDSRRIPLNQRERAGRQGSFPYYGANGQVDSINDYIFDGEFILVAEDGGYFDDPARGVAYEVSGKFWVNNHAHILSLKNGIPRRYLTYALNQLDWMPHVGGSTRLKLTQEGMRRIRIPLAPSGERERIVAKLDNLFDRSKSAREELARIPRLVERYKEAILAAAFRGDLTVDWRQNKPYKATGKQLFAELVACRAKHSIKQTGGVEDLDQPADLQDLPDGWTWCAVAVLASAVSDGVHKKPDYVEQGVPFLTVRNLTAGPGITFDRCRYVTQSDHEEFIKRTHPERGDLLISKDGTLGVVRAVRTDAVFSIFVSVALVKPVDRSLTDYLELAFSSPQVQQQMVGVGTGLQHIHLTDLRRDLIPIAPAEERVEIVKRVHSAFAYIERLETETIRAAKLIDRLDQATLAKAFRGELLPPAASLVLDGEGR